MRKTKQLSLIPQAFTKSFGGSLLEGKRKTARPLSSKHPIHLVIRSLEARGDKSFHRHQKRLDPPLRKLSEKGGVKIYCRVWNQDHLHGIFKFSNRTLYKNWIRELTAMIAKVLNIRFEWRPFTRVLEWGRDLRNAFDYLELNVLELFGLRPKKKFNRRI